MSTIIKTPNEKMLEKLIKEEAMIRMSKEYQDECTAVKDIPNEWLNVTEKMQQKVAKNNEFDDDKYKSCHITCNMMRRARAHILFPDN